jgi:hypothetical protein
MALWRATTPLPFWSKQSIHQMINQCSIHPFIHPFQMQTQPQAGSCSLAIDDDMEVSKFHFQTYQPSFCLTFLLPPNSFKLQIL